MAYRLTLRAIPTRITLASLSRRTHSCRVSGARAVSSDTKGAGAPDSAEGQAKAEAKAAARERARQAEERWIEKLKAEHGDGWKAVFDESQARKERNAEAIREKHRQAKLARQQSQ